MIIKDDILVIDDDEKVLKYFFDTLSPYYRVTIINDPVLAIIELQNEVEYKVIIADYHMPNMNGLEFFKKINKMIPSSVNILTTSHPDLNIALSSINDNDIYRFLVKPINSEELLSIINESVKYYNYKHYKKDLFENTLRGSVKVLVEIISIIHIQNFTHSQQYIKILKDVAKEAGYKDIWEVEIAGHLCKIGYIILDEEIIEKRLALVRMDADELRTYYSHTKTGFKLLNNIPKLSRIANGILHQYQRNDQHEDLPFLSKLLCLVNDFNLLLNNGLSHKKALAKLYVNKGKYDINLLDILKKIILRNKKSARSNSTRILSKNLKREKSHYIRIEDIEEGDVLAEDICDKDGIKFIAEGTLLTENYIHFVQVKKDYLGIKNFIRVFV
jgi:response regulator RpfG family c-di-GMP phosphodiesterase